METIAKTPNPSRPDVAKSPRRNNAAQVGKAFRIGGTRSGMAGEYVRAFATSADIQTNQGYAVDAHILYVYGERDRDIPIGMTRERPYRVQVTTDENRPSWLIMAMYPCRRLPALFSPGRFHTNTAVSSSYPGLSVFAPLPSWLPSRRYLPR